MKETRYVREEDYAYWQSLDQHLTEEMFREKVRQRQALLLTDQGENAGVLRYSLFWDTVPFVNLLYIAPARQRHGLGRFLMEAWEKDMRQKGDPLVMTSTQVNEEAQHFYRKLGYRECGCLLLEDPGFEQPMEMLMKKLLI